MVRITVTQRGDDALLHLPVKARRGLAGVLADWLNVYAGIRPDVLRREHFYLVVELRRLLLAADESAGARAPDDGAGADSGWAETR
jgi:hypothetical protein